MPGCPISIYFVSEVVAVLWCLIYTVFGIVLPTFIGGHRFLNLNGLALYSLTIRR